MATGAILGATAGLAFLPGIDKKAKGIISKAGKGISGFAGDFIDGVKKINR
ncbi:hypothetical protein OXPF_23450 [Oxobacter pfennigii]|uniref:YtxH-like protein n=2 Tax=Oxobacter pfennigii TaxID=36849 RepID=A0A0P8WNP4_9CLOT|nr:hypothetical protein OXPF_23450 [Oxobacter pfennigii]